MSILKANSKLTKLCSCAIWAEGPVWVPSLNSLVFSDVKGSKMYRWDHKDKKLSVFREFSNYANGNTLDKEGRIVSCEHGRRGISRTETDGSVTLLIDKVEGKRFNSPNDVVVRSDGSIWFTDPPYGIIGDAEGYKSESQIIGCYVYCYTPWDGKVYIATTDTQRPNGLAFSPDEKTLYVADMSIIDFPTQGRRELRAYDVENFRLNNGRHFTNIEPGIPDGFRVDEAGNIFCSCEDGIIVVDPEGKHIAKIEVPERVSNCAFGGDNKDELFITATTSLYHIELNTKGAV